MDLIVLIPGILCLMAVFRGGTRLAFLKVVLPVMMFVPVSFKLRLPHLPPLCMLDTALFALGLGMIGMDLPRWRVSRMDGWMVLFIFTSCYSERLPWGVNGAFLHLIVMFCECVVPYMVGKLIAEQPDMRTEIVKRIVLLMTIASILAMPEFVTKKNLFDYFWSHFFPGQWGGATQVRRGFGRVGGPFNGSEQAGIVLMIGVVLALWLEHRKSQWSETFEYLGPPLKRAKLIIVVMIVTVLMIQARGPWLGAVVALTVASIGRAKRPLRQAVLVIGLGLAVGVPSYFAFKDYASGARTDYGSERETAQYRAELIDNYVPIAKLGGAWGWGGNLPVIEGQTSIDNAYLLIWLLQGYVGIASFILIVVEGAWLLVRSGIKTHSHRQRYFIFSLLGILLGLALCLGTVWLAAQSLVLFFLLIGWCEAIRPAESFDTELQEKTIAREVQQVVAMRVYT